MRHIKDSNDKSWWIEGLAVLLFLLLLAGLLPLDWPF